VTGRRSSVSELAGERLGGFDPTQGIRIEVIGSRTGARFVLTSAERVDTVALLGVLRSSAVTQAADFAAITGVRSVASGSVPEDWSPDARRDVEDVFAAAGLPVPVSLGALDTSRVTVWIEIRLDGATYLPGSIVHLTATSSPIVLASAVVGRDGTVRISGTLPINLLGAGEHRVRLVGIRSLDGVTVDDRGTVQLTAATLTEIERFDLRTQATVAVIGTNTQGGRHVALRVVPLEPDAPWWTLWLIAVALVAFGWARRRRRLTSTRARMLGLGLVLLSGVPAIVLGWLSTVTEVAGWSGGLALVALGLAATIREQERDDPEGILPEEMLGAGFAAR
jgi:hypothetical protein